MRDSSFLDDLLEVEIPQAEYEAVKYNTDIEIKKLTKEVREYEKKARMIRKRLKELQAFTDHPLQMIAIIKAEEILKEQGKTPKEIKEFLSDYGITYKVVE